MDPFKTSESKDETYASGTAIDSTYVLESTVRPIQSGDFASKDEEELAAQGKKQQTNVLSSANVEVAISTDGSAEELRFRRYLGVFVHVDAYMGGDVYVRLLPFSDIFHLHFYMLRVT